jgi:hypothetical protein
MSEFYDRLRRPAGKGLVEKQPGPTNPATRLLLSLNPAPGQRILNTVVGGSFEDRGKGLT